MFYTVVNVCVRTLGDMTRCLLLLLLLYRKVFTQPATSLVASISNNDEILEKQIFFFCKTLRVEYRVICSARTCVLYNKPQSK